MPILTKVFVIRMVASSWSVFSTSFKTTSFFLDFSFFSESMSCGEKEKNATSEPEIRAEINNNNNTTIPPKTISEVIGCMVNEKKLSQPGSGSISKC